MSDRDFTPPSRGTLAVIAAGLEKIGGHFVGEGMDIGEGGVGEETDSGIEEEPYEEPYYTAGFDREDVEIAIDGFLTKLAREGLIRKNKSGRLPSFSAVFEKLFGAGHAMVKTAKEFEEHVAGYFGRIDYENMRAAYSEFLEIKKFIAKEMETSGSVENKGLFDADNRPKS